MRSIGVLQRRRDRSLCSDHEQWRPRVSRLHDRRHRPRARGFGRLHRNTQRESGRLRVRPFADLDRPSSDGKSFYAGSTQFCGVLACSGSDAIAEFVRDTATGVLAYEACVTGSKGSGASGSGACAEIPSATPDGDASGLDGVESIVVSPDGKSLYAGSLWTIARFSRDPATGALTYREQGWRIPLRPELQRGHPLRPGPPHRPSHVQGMHHGRHVFRSVGVGCLLGDPKRGAVRKRLGPRRPHIACNQPRWRVAVCRWGVHDRPVRS